MSSHPYFLRSHFLKVSKDADQTELVALRLGTARATAGVRDDAIADTLEESYSADDGLGEEAWQSHETSMDTASTQIIEELERRSNALGPLYPFRLNGDVVTYEQSDSIVYEFLLCTSLAPNLTTGEYTEFPRKFERLATVLTADFVGPNARYSHTGAPNERGRFKQAVSEAISESRELRWQPKDDLPDDGPRHGDAGVDYIIWKDFGCGRAIGQPFYFGQCACGNDWDGKLNDVSAKFFKWFEDLRVSPSKVFAIPFVVPEEKLKEVARDAGIVMDRVRLVKSISSGVHFKQDEWRDDLFQTMCLVGAA